MKLTDLLSVISGLVEVYEETSDKREQYRKINEIPMLSTAFKQRDMVERELEFREVYLVYPYYDRKKNTLITRIIIEGNDKLDEDEDYGADFNEAFDTFAKIR